MNNIHASILILSGSSYLVDCFGHISVFYTSTLKKKGKNSVSVYNAQGFGFVTECPSKIHHIVLFFPLTIIQFDTNAGSSGTSTLLHFCKLAAAALC